MKKLLLLSIILMSYSLMSFSQTVIYNGEDTGVGMWDNFLIDVEEVDNPSKDAVNSTDKCLQLTRIKYTHEIWAGTRAPGLRIENITEYGTLTMMVKKDAPGLVQIEIQTEGEHRKEFLGAHYENDRVGEWQNLEFKLPPNSLGNEDVAIILISIHRENTIDDPNFEDQYMYLDELVLYPKATSADYNGEDKGVGMWDSFLIDAFETDNPLKEGINTTDRCLAINRIKDTEPFAGARAPRFKVSDLNEYEKISMMVKKDVAGPVKLEIQTKDEHHKVFLEAQYEAENLGQWQKLEFSIPEDALDGLPLEIILLQIHVVDTRADDNYTDQLMHVDEMYLIKKGASSVHTTFDKERIVDSNLYSITGAFIKNLKGRTSLSNVPTGIYIQQDIDVNGNKKSKKLVITNSN